MRAFENGSIDVALLPATEAAKLEPRKWEPRLLLARIWLAQGGAARALADARTAIEISDGRMPQEDLSKAREIIALASLALKDLPAAEEALRGLAAQDHAPSLVRLIGLLLDSNRADEANALANDHAPRQPGLQAALTALAGVLAASGAPERERLLAQGALELDAGLYDEALPRFQAVLNRDPNDEDAARGFRAARARKPRAVPAAVDGAAARDAGLLPIARLVTGLLATVLVVAVTLRRDVVASMGVRPEALIAGGFAVLLLALFAGRFQGKTP